MTRESQRLLFLPLATCTCSMSSWSKLLTVKQVKLICMLNFKISPVFFPSALFYVGEIHNMPLPNAQNGTSELEPVVVMWLAPESIGLGIFARGDIEADTIVIKMEDPVGYRIGVWLEMCRTLPRPAMAAIESRSGMAWTDWGPRRSKPR